MSNTITVYNRDGLSREPSLGQTLVISSPRPGQAWQAVRGSTKAALLPSEESAVPYPAGQQLLSATHGANIRVYPQVSLLLHTETLGLGS